MDGGNAISKILFLKARAMKKDAATLVASGPQGTLCSVSSTFIHTQACTCVALRPTETERSTCSKCNRDI